MIIKKRGYSLISAIILINICTVLMLFSLVSIKNVWKMRCENEKEYKRIEKLLNLKNSIGAYEINDIKSNFPQGGKIFLSFNELNFEEDILMQKKLKPPNEEEYFELSYVDLEGDYRITIGLIYKCKEEVKRIELNAFK